MPPTLTVSPLVVEIAVGETFQLAVTPNSHGVKWSCTACHIVSVDNKGLITGLAEGDGEIIARRGNQSVTINVTVAGILPPPPPDPPPQPTIALQVISGQITTDLWLFDTTGTIAGTGDSIVQSSINFSDGAPTIYPGAPPAEITHTFTAATNFVVTLSIQTAFGYVMTISVTVTVLSASPPDPDPVVSPIASLSFVSGQFVGQPVTFTTAGTFDPDGTIASHSIDYGDGFVETNIGPPLVNPVHTYVAPGNYTARLTVFDNANLSASDTAQVTVIAQPTPNQPPIARLVQTAGVLAGDTFVFSTEGSTDPDGQIVSWLFQAGNGLQQSNSGQPPSSIQQPYPIAGSFTARLTVIDNDGATTFIEIPVTVTAVPAPNQPPANVTLSKTSGSILGDTFIFAINGSDPEGLTVTWDLDFGDGSAHATGTGGLPTTRSRVYVVATTVTVKLTVTDAVGLQTVVQLTVVIAPAPPPNLPPTAAVSKTSGAVLGDVFTFALSGGDPEAGPITWRLNFGDNSPELTGTTLPATRSRVYNSASTFTVVFRVTDNIGQTTTQQLAVTVVIPPPSGNTRFERLRARPERALAVGFRSTTDINTYINNDASPWSIDSVWGGAKCLMSPTKGTITVAQQMIMPVRKSGQKTIITTWDCKFSSAFIKQAFGGGYDSTNPDPRIQALQIKQFQHGFGAIGAADDKGTLCSEVQQAINQGTANDIGVSKVRSYSTSGTNWINSTVYENQRNGPGTGPAFRVPPDATIRYVSEFRLNQPHTAFTNWLSVGGTIAPGTYHMYSLWGMKTGTTTRIVYQVPFNAGFPGPEYTAWWFEANTSAGDGGFSQQAAQWFRDFVLLDGYILPASPETDGLIFQQP